MPEESYKNREIDMRFQEVLDKLDEHNEVHEKILTQVIYTNGKLKKVILFLTALAFYVLGLSDIGLTTLVNIIL